MATIQAESFGCLNYNLGESEKNLILHNRWCSPNGHPKTISENCYNILIENIVQILYKIIQDIYGSLNKMVIPFKEMCDIMFALMEYFEHIVECHITMDEYGHDVSELINMMYTRLQ